jgi:hypothetical protein
MVVELNIYVLYPVAASPLVVSVAAKKKSPHDHQKAAVHSRATHHQRGGEGSNVA